MSFGGGTLSSATDVVLSNPVANQYFGYSSGTLKLDNFPLTGAVAVVKKRCFLMRR